MDKDKIGEALSRRRLLGTLGAARAPRLSPRPHSRRADAATVTARPRQPLPTLDGAATAPIKEVFDSTGWNTTALEHFTVDVVDYKKEAAFYIALMGWKLREDNGKQAPWTSAIGAARSSAPPRRILSALPAARMVRPRARRCAASPG